MNLLDKFEASFAHDQAAPCCIANGAVVRRIDFYQLVCKIAKGLHDVGLKPGDLVGLTLPQAPVHLATILAVARLGAISIPVHPKSPPEQKRALMTRHGGRFLIVPKVSETLPKDLGFEVLTLEMLAGPSVVTPKNLRFVDYWPSPETLGRLCLTSGTTGEPGVIAYTQEHWVSRIEKTSHGYDAQTRCIPGDLHLTLGNLSSFAVLLKGGLLVFDPSEDLSQTTKLIALHGVTHAMLSPAALTKLAEAMPVEGNAFPSLKQLRAVGGALNETSFRLARQKLTPHIYLPYGASEIGLISIATPEMQESHPNHAGKPCAGVEVQSVDEGGQVLPHGEVGELRVKIPGMPTSYYKDDEKTKTKFRDGWYYTSDIGCVTSDGYVKVEGRSDDRINLAGMKFFPETVEVALNSHHLVSESAVFSLNDKTGVRRLLAFLVLRPTQGPVDLNLVEFCKQKKFGPLTPSTFIVVDALPKNPSGKLLRKELPALFEKIAAQQMKSKQAAADA